MLLNYTSLLQKSIYVHHSFVKDINTYHVLKVEASGQGLPPMFSRENGSKFNNTKLFNDQCWVELSCRPNYQCSLKVLLFSNNFAHISTIVQKEKATDTIAWVISLLQAFTWFYYKLYWIQNKLYANIFDSSYVYRSWYSLLQ